MAFAINIKTLSSDNYLIVLDGEPSISQIIDSIEKKLGDEINYISDFDYTSTYYLTRKFGKELKEKINSFG